MDFLNVKWVKAHKNLQFPTDIINGLREIEGWNGWPEKPHIIGHDPKNRMIQVHADSNLTLLRVKKIIE
jgi:hypothetical protein